MSTFGAGFNHGPVGTGTQGIGVSTPIAAEVAEATVGLLRLLHIPKGGMLTVGAMSVMTPAGILLITTRGVGRALNGAGAFPKGQDRVAPVHRQKLIFRNPPSAWW